MATPKLPNKLLSWAAVADELNALCEKWANLLDVPLSEIRRYDAQSVQRIGVRAMKQLKERLAEAGVDDSAYQFYRHLQDVEPPVVHPSKLPRPEVARGVFTDLDAHLESLHKVT